MLGPARTGNTVVLVDFDQETQTRSHRAGLCWIAVAAGSSSLSFFLAFGLPGTQCTAIPGIHGLLSTTPAASVMLTATGFVRIYVSGGQQPCFGGAMTVSLPIPAGLPAGAQFSLQALVEEAPVGQFGFSNSVVVIAN